MKHTISKISFLSVLFASAGAVVVAYLSDADRAALAGLSTALLVLLAVLFPRVRNIEAGKSIA